MYQEVEAVGRSLVGAVLDGTRRRELALNQAEHGQDFDMNDLFPPPAARTLETLFSVAREEGVNDAEVQTTVAEYFADTEALLKIPYIKISAVMYAGLARRANFGKKEPPKSLTDVSFISSYMPYCDAMFVDKESAALLTQLPKGSKKDLQLTGYETRVFSLDNKEEFLEYLDELVDQIPNDQSALITEMKGEGYTEPYWDIIAHEKADRR